MPELATTTTDQRRWAPLTLALPTLALLVIGANGCSDPSTSNSQKSATNAAAVDAGLSQDLLAFAVDNLDHLEEFDSQEMMNNIISRLNQWIELQKPDAAWEADPALQTLPSEFGRIDAVRGIATLEFNPADASFLQETVWLRNISRMARGDQADALSQATNLFDWVVRNVQLDADGNAKVRRLPGQTLLMGHGDMLERAWLFILLARQQQLDVVMLGLPAKDDPQKIEPWLPALLENGQLYLFDPKLGMPIPGPDGKGVATLSEVVADEALLRHLDLDDDHPYPVDAEQLKGVVALIEASPLYLSRRMSLFESQMAGDERLVVSVDASDLMRRAKESPHITDARLWTFPYEVIDWQMSMDQSQQIALLRGLMPFFEFTIPTKDGPINPLWKARIHHFKGIFTGEENANLYYQLARPADVDLDAAALQDAQRDVLITAKRNASYWLGIVAYERGLYEAAVEHFQTRTLKATPAGPWTYGARFNLARTYEAQGNLEKAIELYEEDTSPQRHGNRLRAKWLKEKMSSGAATEKTERDEKANPESPVE